MISDVCYRHTSLYFWASIKEDFNSKASVQHFVGMLSVSSIITGVNEKVEEVHV